MTLAVSTSVFVIMKASVRGVAKKLQAEKERADKMAEAAKDANEAKGRFLANMSHESRTPSSSL